MPGVLAALLWGSLGGCRGGEDPAVPEWTANSHGAEVEKVVRAGDRALLYLVEGPFKFWASVPAEAIPDVKAGDHVWLGKGKEKLVTDDAGERHKAIVIEQVAISTPLQLATFEKLEPPEGGVSIAELFARKTELAGQEVKLRGRISKASYDVFETNWYHLRDGTGVEADKTNDVTITTKERFEVGEVAVATGLLTIDKDLGFGYFYPAIVEDGVLVVEGTRRAPPKDAGAKKPAFPGAEGPPPTP